MNRVNPRVGVWIDYLDRIRLLRFGNQNPLLYQHPIRFLLIAPNIRNFQKISEFYSRIFYSKTLLSGLIFARKYPAARDASLINELSL